MLNLREFSVVPIPKTTHLIAILAGVCAGGLRYLLSGSLEPSTMTMVMTAFWGAAAYYSYDLGARARYQGVPSAIFGLLGLFVGGVVMVATY